MFVSHRFYVKLILNPSTFHSWENQEFLCHDMSCDVTQILREINYDPYTLHKWHNQEFFMLYRFYVKLILILPHFTDGKSRIFVSFRFYVKSIIEILEARKITILTFSKAMNFDFSEFLAKSKC